MAYQQNQQNQQQFQANYYDSAGYSSGQQHPNGYYDSRNGQHQGPVQGSVNTAYIDAPAMGEMVTLPRPTQMPPANQYYEAPQPVYQDQYAYHQDDYGQQYAVYAPDAYGQNMYFQETANYAPPSPSHSQEFLVQDKQAPLPLPKDDAVRRFDEEFVYKDKPARRCMYCCIPVNKRHRTYCLVGVALFLVAVGVLLYFFFPRMPQFQILGIVPADSNAYSLTGFYQSDPSKLNFSMNMILTVAVVNTNPYHFKVENINLAVMIDANGTMINNASPITASNFFGGAPLQSPRPWVTKDNFRNQIATGSVGVTTFPAGQNITFRMPLAVSYSPNKSMGVYDPTLNEIIQVCTYDYNQQNTPNSGPLTRVINIHYKAENNIGLLKYIGMTPTIEGASRINCPFQGKDLNDFMEKLKSGGL